MGRVRFSCVVYFLGCLWIAHVRGFFFRDFFSYSEETCDEDVTRFTSGQQYLYHYHVVTSSKFAGGTDVSTGSKLSCDVTLKVPQACNIILELSNCSLSDVYADGLTKVSNQSQVLEEQLQRNPIQFSYKDGAIVDQELYVWDDDPVHVVNIKRGIVSIFQLPKLPEDETSDYVEKFDVLGSCSSKLQVSDHGDDQDVNTFTDLATCNLRHINEGQLSLLSFIKTLNREDMAGPITQLSYPFESSVSCNYKIGPSNILKNVTCTQNQIFLPWSSKPQNGKERAAPTLLVSQSITLLTQSSLDSDEVDWSTSGTKLVNLEMEYEDGSKSSTSRETIYSELLEVLDAFNRQGGEMEAPTENSAERFKKLVSLLRDAPKSQILKEKRKVFTCRYFDACFEETIGDKTKGLIQRIFLNGLMSCGTDSCVTVFALCVNEGLIPDFEAKSALFNMGLFYKPSSSVARILLEFCQNHSNNSCWLSVSALVNRLAEEGHTEDDVASVVKDTISSVVDLVGVRCDSNDGVEDPELIIALKSLINIGESVLDLYEAEEEEESKEVGPRLLKCIKNEKLSFTVARSAVQALSKAGLVQNLPYVMTELLEIAQDESREIAVRTAVFDVLIIQEEIELLRSLLEILDTTQLENMQTYIVTKVDSILESLDPRMTNLKSLLRELMEKRTFPKLGDNILTKSHHTQLTRYFTIPVTSMEIGIDLAVNLIYTPSSNVFRSLTIMLGFSVEGKKIELFEVNLDVKDMDMVLKFLKQNKNGRQSGSGPKDGENMLDILQEFIQRAAQAQVPEFTHYSSKVVEALRGIAELANIQKAAFPQVIASLRFLGYEVGYMSSDAMLETFKQLRNGDSIMKMIMQKINMGVHWSLVRAFTLEEEHMILPSVAGIPLDFHRDITVVTKGLVDLNLPDNIYRRNGLLSAEMTLAPSMAISIDAVVKVSIGDLVNSGLQMKATGSLNDHRATYMRYRPMKDSSGVINHDLLFVKELGDKNFTFLDIKTKPSIFLNNDHFTLKPTIPKKIFDRCLPEIYTKLTGHRTCLQTNFYPGSNDQSSMFAGPSSLQGWVSPNDLSMTNVTLHVTHKNVRLSSQPSEGYETITKLEFEGQGSELSRQASFSVIRNDLKNSLIMEGEIPEAGIKYSSEKTAQMTPSLVIMRMKSVLSQFGQPLSSLIVEQQVKNLTFLQPVQQSLSEASVPMKKIKMTHFNISFGELSVDVKVEGTETGTDRTMKAVLNYYCTPNLRLLYGLHSVPELAAVSGHTSTVSFFSKSSEPVTDVPNLWKAHIMTEFLTPAQNMTTVTHMRADLEGADRITDIFWADEKGTDSIQMSSHVVNASTKHKFLFDYSLHLVDEGKFVIDMYGSVDGPRAMPLAQLGIYFNISYETIQHGRGDHRHRRSLVTTLKDKATASFQAAKAGLVSWFGRTENTTTAETPIIVLETVLNSSLSSTKISKRDHSKAELEAKETVPQFNHTEENESLFISLTSESMQNNATTTLEKFLPDELPEEQILNLPVDEVLDLSNDEVFDFSEVETLEMPEITSFEIPELNLEAFDMNENETSVELSKEKLSSEKSITETSETLLNGTIFQGLTELNEENENGELSLVIATSSNDTMTIQNETTRSDQNNSNTIRKQNDQEISKAEADTDGSSNNKMDFVISTKANATTILNSVPKTTETFDFREDSKNSTLDLEQSTKILFETPAAGIDSIVPSKNLEESSEENAEEAYFSENEYKGFFNDFNSSTSSENITSDDWTDDITSIESVTSNNSSGEQNGFNETAEVEIPDSLQRDIKNSITEQPNEPLSDQQSPSLWELPRWNMSVRAEVRLRPQFSQTPSGMKLSGMSLGWNVTAAVPSGGEDIIKANGTFFKGSRHWMRLFIQDKLHDFQFEGAAEQYLTPQVFHHHHNWSLVEYTAHSFDRSFNLRLDFEHYKRFDYSLKLVSPRTNLTHNINYTKLTDTLHQVRADGRVHSEYPPFDLVYYEASDLDHGRLTTYANMTSTLLDYQLELSKTQSRQGLLITSRLEVDGKYSFLKGHRELATQLSVFRKRPPTLVWSYTGVDGASNKVTVMMMGIKHIQIGLKVIPPNLNNTDDEVPNLLTWHLKLTEPTQLTHTIELSSQARGALRYLVHKLPALLAHSIQEKGNMLAHNVRADLKDTVLPFSKQGLNSWLGTQLHHSMKQGRKNISVKLYKLSLGVLNALDQLWKKSPKALLMQGSHLDELIANGVNATSSALAQSVIHPPVFINNFVRVYIQPSLSKTFRTGEVQFSVPLPFVMSGFHRLPQPTVIEKEAIAMLKRKLSGATGLTHNIAVILDGYSVKTFDGLVYDITEPASAQCTYLLAGDFRHGQFVMTYTKEAVTVTSGLYGISLGRDGSMATIGEEQIKELPYTTLDQKMTLSVQNGELHLELTSGLVKVTFDPNSDFFLFDMEQELNNVSLGLLGTNNMEKGDDKLLSNGEIASSKDQFLSQYELVGKKCDQISSATPVTCNNTKFSVCMSLSDLWPEVVPCFMVLDPMPFIDQCGLEECMSKSGCNAVKAYVSACRHRGVTVSSLPPLCVACHNKPGLDVVFVQSLHQSVVEDTNVFATVLNVMENLTSLDTTVGVVTYGGQDHHKLPRSLLLGGSLLGKPSIVTQDLHKIHMKSSNESVSADAALSLAADYPFRDGVGRVVFVLYPNMLKEKQNDALIEKFKSRNIHLVLASSYPEFSSSRVLGLHANARVIGEGERISKPQDAYTKLVETSGGTWLDLDVLRQGISSKIKKMMQTLVSLSKNVSKDCSPEPLMK